MTSVWKASRIPYVVLIGRKYYMLISYAAMTPEGAVGGRDEAPRHVRCLQHRAGEVIHRAGNE